jgi:hypothetical protein
MSSLSPSPKFRGVDTTTGLALVGGKLYTYSAGTLTPKNTYTSSTLGTPNANPTILDSRGEADVWLDGAYKFILKDSLDNTIWTVDNITDPTNGATFTSATFAGTTALVNLTVSGTTALGDAVADTLSVSGTVVKNGTGNWSLPAPSAGATLAVAGGVAGTATFAAPSSGDTITVTGTATITGPALKVGAAGSGTGGSIRFTSDAGTSQWLTGILGSPAATAWTVFNLVSSATPISVATAGNITFAAPSSGVGFTGTGFAGSDAFVYNGGTSGSFRVNTTGVPYGTSLHNNAGAVTGTTNQYITSGDYVPTVADVANTAARAGVSGHWQRVGNNCTGSFSATVDPTAADTLTQVSITLPPVFSATNFTGNVAIGSAASSYMGTDANAPSVGQLNWLGGTKLMVLTFQTGTDVSNQTWSGTFSFTIP